MGAQAATKATNADKINNNANILLTEHLMSTFTVNSYGWLLGEKSCVSK
jgi:hypothetical protein